MKRGKLRVHVSPGLFSKERTASFEAEGGKYTLIVDEEDVVDNQLLVYILQEDDRKALIHLPRETLNAGSRVVVPRSALTWVSA